MPSDAMRTISELIRRNRDGAPPGRSVQERRDAMAEAQAQLVVPEDVEQLAVDAAGVPARWFRAPGADPARILLYFHGGGYVMGSVDTHRELLARLSRATGCAVLGVDYRLAPEHPYPAAVGDALTAWRWLRTRHPTARPAIGGDSAGGGLSLALLLRLRSLGEPLPEGAVLFSPWTDLMGAQPSHRERMDADPMIDLDGLHEMAGHYAGGRDRADPELSPIFADPAGLPPLLIQVGDAEVLLDDARVLADRARDAGVDVSCRVFDGAFHVFQAVPQLPEADATRGLRIGHFRLGFDDAVIREVLAFLATGRFSGPG